jgi:hypothetical protein
MVYKLCQDILSILPPCSEAYHLLPSGFSLCTDWTVCWDHLRTEQTVTIIVISGGSFSSIPCYLKFTLLLNQRVLVQKVPISCLVKMDPNFDFRHRKKPAYWHPYCCSCQCARLIIIIRFSFVMSFLPGWCLRLQKMVT